MDGIVGKVPALGPLGWQGDENLSEMPGWKRVEANSQMKTPWHLAINFDIIVDIFKVLYLHLKGRGDMVRQAKLGRTNRMKGICTAKKTTCR